MKHRNSWKKYIVLSLVVLLAFGFAACSQSIGAPSATEAPAATPVPMPTAEPVITTGDPMPLPLEDATVVPAGYTRVETEDATLSLFAFTDSNGALQYRVFGGYTEFVDGVAGETIKGFYPSDETGAILADAKAFVDPATEPFGTAAITPIPDTIRLRAAYTLTETGLITGSAGGAFVYGSFAGGEGAFYPADSTGKMIPGALPTTENISVPSYTPTSVPAAEGDRMICVYIGSQSVVVYKAVGGEWTQERVMICSTGRSKDMTPRGTFHLVRQYPYKKMGQIKGENVYSQYASRIVGSYLFHSVPIGGDKRNNQEYGKKQMYVKYYESLGTIASGGCVRLRCGDAYWIYMNCVVGTEINISDDTGPTPPTPPALIYEEPYMDARHEYGWDPSDPDPENPYHKIYTPEFVLDGPVVDKSKD